MLRAAKLAVLLFQLVIASCVVSFPFQFEYKLLESKDYVLKFFINIYLCITDLIYKYILKIYILNIQIYIFICIFYLGED